MPCAPRGNDHGRKQLELIGLEDDLKTVIDLVVPAARTGVKSIHIATFHSGKLSMDSPK